MLWPPMGSLIDEGGSICWRWPRSIRQLIRSANAKREEPHPNPAADKKTIPRRLAPIYCLSWSRPPQLNSTAPIHWPWPGVFHFPLAKHFTSIFFDVLADQQAHLQMTSQWEERNPRPGKSFCCTLLLSFIVHIDIK